MQYMRQCIADKLKNSDQSAVEVYSAFNGLAIHKTRRFENIRYDGYYASIEPFLKSEETLALLEHLRQAVAGDIQLKRVWEVPYCEHVYYYWTAAKQNGCVIKVSKFQV